MAGWKSDRYHRNNLREKLEGSCIHTLDYICIFVPGRFPNQRENINTDTSSESLAAQNHSNSAPTVRISRLTICEKEYLLKYLFYVDLLNDPEENN